MSVYASWYGAGVYNATVAAPAGLNTKGLYTELSASTTFDSSRLYFVNRSQNTVSKCLLDISTGAAGVETVRCADIMLQRGVGGQDSNMILPLNIDIPSGTRIAMRMQSSVTITTVAPYLIQEDVPLASISNPVTYGSNLTTSGGVTVDTGAVVDTKGAYSQITASTTVDIDAIACIHGMNNTLPANAGFKTDIATGAAGSETIVAPDFSWTTTALGLYIPNVFQFNLVIPSGTRLAVRAQSTTTNATDRVYEAIIIGMQVPTVTPGSSGEHSAVF